MQNTATTTAEIGNTYQVNATNGHGPALQRSLLICLLLYLTFVIYGSLVPLHYVPISFDEALSRYSQIRYLDLGMQSRADWVANILLFIPLAFLLCAVSFKEGAKRRNLFLGAAIVLSGFTLALSIEFIQLYFPQRTVSINDIVAETLGAAFGVALYKLYGLRVKQFLLGVALVRGQASVLSYLLLIYSALFFLYYLLPLDLTLSPIELYKKWQDGRIVLLPFSAYKGNLVQVSYAIASDIVLWLPIALLWLANFPNQPKLVFYSRLVLMASLLEFCQLFVYSRVTDISDIICALLAGVLAQVIVKQWRQHKGGVLVQDRPAAASKQLQRSLLWCGAALLYSLFLMLLFWYPFNFNFDWSFIDSRWQFANSQVLLYSLYFGTEFRAITALSQKILTFIPLGVFFALAWLAQQQRWQQQLLTFMALLYIVSLASVIEGMQLALPGKTVDATDVILKVVGAALGFAGYLFFYRRARVPAPAADRDLTPAARPAAQKQHASGPILSPGRLLILHLLITVVLLFAVSNLAVLPYNVRELLSDNNTAILGLTLSLYLMTLPLLLPLQQFAVFTLLSPLLILIQSILVFSLLFATVPRESLHDILGAPVSNLPVYLELLLRFCGFFSVFQFNYLFAGRLLQERNSIPALILWAIFSLLFAAIWYGAVVKLAATDNVTELLANRGSYGVALGLSLYLAMLFGSAAYLSRLIMPDKPLNDARQSHGFWRLSAAILGLLLVAIAAWLLLNTITESLIIKYQQVFSALQFLLSTDRDNYVSPTTLKLRYAIAHLALVLILAWFYLWARQLQRLAQSPAQRASAKES
ncbi:hypothetical protein GCM10008111_18380 [Alishewanella tabrizica]|uniref:VanZ-like domain-containing protein n=2 Tax=Alishewanella tabrizica TaxID=671278 RepID=A0ABQ2WM99_9ALTE|nr:hypothetical protein GCM10008111_18380 [Alishewanella tabrizica]